MLTINKQQFSQSVRQLLQQTDQIPPLTETTRALIKLRNNPEASMTQLVDLVGQDPALAAFIIKYARMSIFGYGNRIVSVHQAVSLVLGFNTTLNLSMSISASGSLRLPNQGALGRVVLWTQALECAALCRELYSFAGSGRLFDGDIAYLCGLLHNFGYMLFAHLYPKEFSYLNELVTRYPEQDVRALQLQTFGIAHDTIGMYLIRLWDLPDEIAVAVAEQHYPDYAGKHAQYVKLLALVRRLMQNQGESDACSYIDTAILVKELAIDDHAVNAVLEKIRQNRQEFSALAQSLVA